MRTYRLKCLVSASLLAVGLTVGLSVLPDIPKAQAHGAVVEVNPASVEIKAAFDTGEPMSEAQVLLYSPTDLSTPVVKGQTDSEGRFLFSPDPDLIADLTAKGAEDGRWEVTVRKAGHGQVTTFGLGNGILQTATDSSTGLAVKSSNRFTYQQWISMAAIIWGFVGTALYFRARAYAKTTNTKPPISDWSNGRSAAIAPDVASTNVPKNAPGSDR